MKRLLSLLLSLTFLLSTTAVFAQDATEEAMSSATIVDIASGSDDFNTLLAAVEAAGLGETLATGEFTVFAPTDGAFETLLNDLGISAEDLLADTDMLTNVLTYHVFPGTITFADLESLAAERNDGLVTVETVNGAEVRIQVDANQDTAGINEGAASIVQADLMASNGVIHVIDNVLLPPMEMEEDTTDATEEAMMATEEATMEEDMGAGSLVEVAAGNENFSILATAIEAAGLVEALESDEFTVFAPTDAAFANLLGTTGLTQEELLASELLSDILLYHVVAGSVPASSVVELDGSSVETMLEDNSVSISVTEEGGVVLNGVVNVTQTDITADNGIIHVIDEVLLPQAAIDALGL